MTINARRAFYTENGDDDFLAQLSVTEAERKPLRAARDEIRATLKQGMADWSHFMTRSELFESSAIALLARDAAPPLRPKFRMQGSWSYDTLNRVTQDPPQEIDLDDGMFLPVSFLSQNGSAHPAIVSSGYFRTVEAILTPLCDDNDWVLITDMPSCVRVELKQGAHIDIALYAIPDDDFRTLVEKADAALHHNKMRDQELMFAEDVYPRLPSDHIMLAHREEGWKPSDPRKLETWFQEAVDRHGYQLRRVCRYLKGWRDSRWDQCRLSSIALMACAVTAFDEADAKPAQTRDDVAFEMVAARLPALLSGRIANPVVAGLYLDDKWQDCRADFVAQAQKLHASLSAALASSSPTLARNTLCGELGVYMPTNLEYFVVDGPSGPGILSQGILQGLGAEEPARAAVQLGGDDRYG